MKASFVRTVGAADRIYVVRSDGSEASWSFPSYGDGLPHDLVHFVVEAAFGVDGVWAAVDRGLDLARASAMANRRGGAGKYEAAGLGGPGVMVAEALANAPWFLPGTSDENRLAAICSACAAAGIEVPGSIVLERITKVRERLEALGSRWRGLKPRGAIDMVFGQ